MLSSVIILQLLCFFADQRLINNDGLLGRAWRDVIIYPFRLWHSVSSAVELYRLRYLNRLRMWTNTIDVCFDRSLK